MRILVVAALMASLPSAVQAETPSDRYAWNAIGEHNYGIAEKRLLRRLRVDSGDQAALVNLARVYAKTGRYAAARATYQRLLTLEDVLLASPAGNPVSSHRIARKALGQTASR